MFSLRLGCFTTALVIGLLLFIAYTVNSGCDRLNEISKPTKHEIVNPDTIPEGTMYVHFLDVGQGDCTLIDLGDFEVVIDTGRHDSTPISYIDTYVDGPLEIVVASHPDADHIGDMDDLFDAFVVESAYDSGDTKTTQTFTRYEGAVEAEGLTSSQPKRGDVLLTDPFYLQVLNPEEGSSDDFNENSVALLLIYGDVNVYLMADVEEIGEEEIVDEFDLPKAHFLKAGHHGSKTSSSSKFMDEIQPDNVVYSAGEGNSYGHPHAESITTWEEYDALIMGTDTHGTIVLSTDGTVEGSWLEWENE